VDLPEQRTRDRQLDRDYGLEILNRDIHKVATLPLGFGATRSQTTGLRSQTGAGSSRRYLRWHSLNSA
jgi:hypothetical protein